MMDRERLLRHEADIRQQIWDREDKRDAQQARDLETQIGLLKKQHYRELGVFGGLIALATIASGILGGLASRGVDLWPF